jgi:Lrp/AsnC family transcriptional regulator for asnA, asnC and gidA
MLALDELDTKLIDLLQHDGRASNIELARMMGVSEGTIRRRFRNLVKDEVIRVVAIPDVSKMGRQTSALIGLQVDPAYVEFVATELAKFDEVQYSAVTTGAYDVFCRVALGSPAELSEFLRNCIGDIEGVRRSETFVNLSIKKNGGGPVATSNA